MNDPWIPHVSGWRLYIMALAIKNGHCPKLAEERHRKWCIDQGFEMPFSGTTYSEIDIKRGFERPIGDQDVETRGTTEAPGTKDASEET